MDSLHSVVKGCHQHGTHGNLVKRQRFQLHVHVACSD
jgi:hypothetical protein